MNHSKLKRYLAPFLLFICNPSSLYASSQYLPLKKNWTIELEIERLAVLTGMPALTKPYSVHLVYEYLQKLPSEHSTLKSRINFYLRRYKKDRGITDLSFNLQHADIEDKNIPNQRGLTSSDSLEYSVSGFHSFGHGFSVNASTILGNDSGKELSGSYFSYESSYLQIDAGYKEHWFSPFQESSMLFSTNAKAPVNISFSNPLPLTAWNIRYELVVGKLVEQQGIVLDRGSEETTSGSPGLIAMHLGFQPFDWWTLGFNRMLMFGGGERKMDLSMVWEAIIDPVSSDNCGGASSLQDCTLESGNQQASITSRFDFYWLELPFSFYFEFAGEDTRGFKNYLLSNRAESIGLFFPYLNENSSLLFEYNRVENAWYSHHLYAEGFRNDLGTIGHWWGDEKQLGDSIGASISTVRYTHQIGHNELVSLTYRDVFNDPEIGDPGSRNQYSYSREKTWELNYERFFGKYSIGAKVYAGKDVFSNDFYMLDVHYQWQ